MNDRERLLDRFRATLKERLRVVTRALTEEDGDETLQHELHTLKGELRLLGLGLESDLAHAVEERLPELAEGSPSSPIDLRALLSEALAVLSACLDETGGAANALSSMLERLRRPDGATDPPDHEGGSESEMPRVEAAEPSAPVQADPARVQSRWVQVEASSIQRLCDRIAELASAYTAMQARAHRQLSTNAGAPPAGVTATLEGLSQCRALLDECTAAAWALRLTPVEPTLRVLAHHAGRLAREAGKEIDVVVNAAGVHLESDVLDQLWESLLHLVQNAVAHGFDAAGATKGTLEIAARPAGSHVELIVEDDGGGIDTARVAALATKRGLLAPGDTLESTGLLDVLCHPGFSTTEHVDTLAGRGVGLAVVRSKLEGLGGALDLRTHPGRGTRFVLKVPFAVTRERLLILKVAGLHVGLPSRIVQTILRAPDDSERSAHGHHTLRVNGSHVPLRSLSGLLGAGAEPEPLVLVLELTGRLWALAVPAVVGEQDLIRTPADPLLASTTLFGSTASLDDGDVVLLPQLDRLLQLLRREGHDAPRPTPRARRARVLVVDDSPVVRDLVTDVLSGAGLEVTVAENGADGLRSLEASEPDVVLSDVEMPVMDGFEFLRNLRDRTQRVPVIMLTTRASVEDRKRATALGANAYLTKADFRAGALLDTLARFVDVTR